MAEEDLQTKIKKDIQAATQALATLTKSKLDSISRELTQSEYDALSDEEKNNGTVYYIKDSEIVPQAKVIDDNVKTDNTTWSSEKIDTTLNGALVNIKDFGIVESVKSLTFIDTNVSIDLSKYRYIYVLAVKEEQNLQFRFPVCLIPVQMLTDTFEQYFTNGYYITPSNYSSVQISIKKTKILNIIQWGTMNFSSVSILGIK